MDFYEDYRKESVEKCRYKWTWYLAFYSMTIISVRRSKDVYFAGFLVWHNRRVRKSGYRKNHVKNGNYDKFIWQKRVNNARMMPCISWWIEAAWVKIWIWNAPTDWIFRLLSLVEHKSFHLNLLQIAWIPSRSWLAALLRDGESPVPNYDLRSRVMCEKEAWASLQLLLSAKVRPRVNPILQNRIKQIHAFSLPILAFLETVMILDFASQIQEYLEKICLK